MLKKENSHPFLEGLLIGSTLGAIAVFMVGTKKGKELRHELFHKYKLMQPKIKNFKSYLLHAKKSLLAGNLKDVVKKTVKRKAQKIKRKLKRK